MPSLPELPPLNDLFSHVYETIRARVVPYLDIARNMANINMPPPTQTPSPTPQKLPYPQARRLACTHLTMQRVYGEQRCPICRRDPDLGYTYLCSQDENEDEIDGGSSSHTKLSPWIEEAIVKGEYTPEQVTILKAQKEKVNKTIATALENFRLSESSGTDKQSTMSSYLPFPVMNAIKPGMGVIVPKQSEARLFPYCEVRACQTCRPTFRDRAWQKFDDIFSTDQNPTIDFEDDNRRLSDPSIVANLGLQKPMQNVERAHLPTFDGFSLYQNPRPAKRALSDTTVRQRSSTTASSDIADQRVGHESTGIRDGLKRAFRGVLLNRRNSTASRQSTRSSRLISRKMRVREEDSTEDRVEFNTALCRRLNDELLRAASTTKLPGHDGMDGLEAQVQEVEVGDGVAVTEEAVDIGTPDIIMSV